MLFNLFIQAFFAQLNSLKLNCHSKFFRLRFIKIINDLIKFALSSVTEIDFTAQMFKLCQGFRH